MIEVKIELDKIDKTKIFTSEKTGKKYLDICVAKRQTPDKFGSTHTVYIRPKQGEEKVYIGSGVGKYEDAVSIPAQSNNTPVPETNGGAVDDLPF